MGGERLFIASPSFSSNYSGEYVQSLFASLKHLQANGVKTLYKQVNGVHWIDIARDIICELFLKSDCTHLLQIDADLGWQSDAITRMLSRDKDIIGGVYPIKADVEYYPLSEHGLPAGFLMVKREVIEKMAEGLPKYKCASLEYGQMHVAPLFNRMMFEDRYIGEDYAFCIRAKEAGFKLHVETDIAFKHVGLKQWSGNFKGQ